MELLNTHERLAIIEEEVDWKDEMACFLRRVLDIPEDGQRFFSKT